jgi:hypothetical protein
VMSLVQDVAFAEDVLIHAVWYPRSSLTPPF